MFYQILNFKSILNNNYYNIPNKYKTTYTSFFKKYVPIELFENNYSIKDLIEYFGDIKIFYTGKL